ncbi:MAG: farnesyl diphosphate synthase [Myxococcota bacterium]|jgi:farnesyl diphosphate synthase
MNLQMVMTTSFKPWLAGFAQGFEAQFQEVLGSELVHDSRLQQAMRSATLSGGKRIRPALCTLVAGNGATPECVARVSMAIEAVHTYSLVHDDLPAMDDDCLRRGRATTHIEFDEATAILCGDALLTFAFELLADLDLPADKALQLVKILSTAIGQRGMVMGQQLDIDATSNDLSWEQVQEIHNLKTGALITASIHMGAVLGDGQPQQWTDFASQIGVLFQVVDDVLDATVDSQQLGKTAGKDSATHKPTAVSSLGVDGARQYAQKLCDDAKSSLAVLNIGADNPLIQLPDFLLHRSF